jgi:hypothetical protein
VSSDERTITMYLSEDVIREHHRELLREAEERRLLKEFSGFGQVGRSNHILSLPTLDVRPLAALVTLFRARLAARRVAAERDACATC